MVHAPEINPSKAKPKLIYQLGQVWVATTFANMLLYLFQLVVGRSLGPEDYSLFGALFGIVYLAGALTNGVRVSVAKFVADARATNQGAETGLLVSSAMFQMLLLGTGFVAFFSLASPWIGSYLHSTRLTPVLITGAVIAVSLLLPVARGALQGAQRFAPFSGTLILEAGSRLALGGAALALNMGVIGVLAAVGLSNLISMGIGLAFIKPPLVIALKALPTGTLAKILIPTTIGALAINLPTSADVVIVRHFFPAAEAGLYAGATVLGRVVLFLPMAISIVLFPKIASESALGHSGRGLLYKGLAVTALMSGGVCLALVIFPSLALAMLLGGEYASAQNLVPIYSAAMFFMSLAVVYLYYYLAVGRKAYLYILLLPHLALELGLIYVFHQSLTQVVLILLTVNISLAVSSEAYTRIVDLRILGKNRVAPA